MLRDQFENGVSVSVTRGSVPYGLAVSDAGVCVIAYDDGSIVGGMFSSRSTGREWGKGRYQAHRERAREVRYEAV
jgi:hypothetical protein